MIVHLVQRSMTEEVEVDLGAWTEINLALFSLEREAGSTTEYIRDAMVTKSMSVA